jgi:hypothetical protein
VYKSNSVERVLISALPPLQDLKRTYWNGTNAVKAIAMNERPDYWYTELAPEVEREDAIYCIKKYPVTLISFSH